MRVGQRVTPLETIGCYIPGGRFSLFSTLLMTAIPAQVAGVKRIVVACPQAECRAAGRRGDSGRIGNRPHRRRAGHRRVRLWDASVPRVDKIFGPGNRYVTAAKRMVSADCAIDMLAGPTEVLVVATRGEARYIAADLLAQAEHDPDADRLAGYHVAQAGRGDFAPSSRATADLPETNPARRSLAAKARFWWRPHSTRRFALRIALRRST